MGTEKKKDNQLLIERLLKYCGRIDNHMRQFNYDYDALLHDELLQDACVSCYIQIGETAKFLSSEIKELGPAYDADLYQIVGMRNRLTHEYESIDYSMLADSIQTDIPKLVEFCKYLKEHLRSQSEPDEDWEPEI